jgi:hypothetical protein
MNASNLALSAYHFSGPYSDHLRTSDPASFFNMGRSCNSIRGYFSGVLLKYIEQPWPSFALSTDKACGLVDHHNLILQIATEKGMQPHYNTRGLKSERGDQMNNEKILNANLFYPDPQEWL